MNNDKNNDERNQTNCYYSTDTNNMDYHASPVKRLYLSHSELDTMNNISASFHTISGAPSDSNTTNAMKSSSSVMSNSATNTPGGTKNSLQNLPDLGLKRSLDSSVSLSATNSMIKPAGNPFARPHSKKMPPPPPQAFTAIADLASYQSDSAIVDHNLPFLFNYLISKVNGVEFKYDIDVRRQSAYSILIIARNTPTNFDRNIMNLMFDSLAANSDRCIQKSLIIALYDLSENKKCCEEMIDSNFIQILSTLMNQDTDQLIFLSTALIHNLILWQPVHFKPLLIANDFHKLMIKLLARKSQKFLALVIDILYNLAQNNMQVKFELMQSYSHMKIMHLMHLDIYSPLLICSCKLLLCLASSPSYQVTILDAGLPNIICRLFASSDMKVVENSLKLLLIVSANLSNKLQEDLGYCSQKNRLLFFLVKCIKSSNHKVQKYSMQILSNLLSDNDNLKNEVILLNAHVSFLEILQSRSITFSVLESTLVCMRYLLTVTHEDSLVNNVVEHLLNSNGFNHINSLICSNTNLMILIRILQLLKQFLLQISKLEYPRETMASFNQFPLFILYINHSFTKIVTLDSDAKQNTISNYLTPDKVLLYSQKDLSEIFNRIIRLILENMIIIFNLTTTHMCLMQLNEEFCRNLILNIDSDDTQISSLAHSILRILLMDESYNYTWCSIDLQKCKNLTEEAINKLYGFDFEPKSNSTLIHDSGTQKENISSQVHLGKELPSV
ncbi:MAG: Catenin beta-1 [Marteilia pararefringens]